MRCAACGRENTEDNSFCIHCGAPLEAERPEAGTEPEDAVEALRVDVRRLSAEVAELRRAMAEHGLTARPGTPRTGPVRGPDASPGAASTSEPRAGRRAGPSPRWPQSSPPLTRPADN